MNSSNISDSGGRQAIILAAGRGWRMRPLSDECHKSLLKIGGRTILEGIIDALLNAGIEEILVVTGYRAQSIRETLDSAFPEARLSYLHNKRWETTNNIVSLSLAFDTLEVTNDIVVIECDLVFNPGILETLLAVPGNAALVSPYGTGMDGTVVTVASENITAVHPPHAQGATFDYDSTFKTLNIYKFEHRFCSEVLSGLLHFYAESVDPNSYYELVLGMLVSMQHQQIRAVVVPTESWAEIDDPNDLEVARFAFEPEHRLDHVETTHGAYWNLDLLDFGHPTNPFFPPPAMMAAMRRALPNLVAAYGSTQDSLDQKLAYVLKCSAENLRCLNGASQAFPLLAERWKDRPVLLPRPTFLEWPATFPFHEIYEDRPGLDLEMTVNRAQKNSILVIVNPNNPTGTVVPTADILKLAAHRPDVLFVIDESFAAFAAQSTCLDLIDTQAPTNITVLTSLGKAFGVPGLRIGGFFTPDRDLHRWIGERLPIWNSNALAEFFLETVLKYRTEFEESVRLVQRQRTFLADRLDRSALVDRVFPSAANFLLLRLAPGDPGSGRRLVQESLGRDRILLKDVSDRFPDDHAYLRVAVRSHRENERLLEALERFSEENTD